MFSVPPSRVLDQSFFLSLPGDGRVTNYEGVDATAYCSSNALNESSATIDKILSWMETFEIDIEQV